ncbi:hypothetical protein L484_004967 [Morus notabilis]|uniref:Uncharacterized protein n=1 Tax=Morus notabilis TaxID=981085 RepID=W9REF1_9ROSA|nr:hypothetical protein L484_004967 [Morus notabilis]
METIYATLYLSIDEFNEPPILKGSNDTLCCDSGTTPHTVSNKEWWEETDKKLQAWPRTAGPPVVMNPISRQNFIVKSHTEA